jgi:hypothetical protein
MTASELGLPGAWQVRDPGIEKPNDVTEYVVSWAV